MSNKYIQAEKAFFRRDFLLYVLTVLYVFLAMPGCRCRSLPLSTSNFTLKNLTHKCKKKYLQVVQQLGEDGTERLEKTIASIINPCEVNKFIANLSDYFALCDGVLALLPESKRDRFQQAVSGLFDPIDQGKSINKLKVEQRLQARKSLIDKNYPNEAKVITQLFKLTCEHCSQSAWKPCAKSACKYCSKPTCKHYIDRLIDLSTLLLEDQFITLKNTIIHSTDPEESGRLITSRFTQLVNCAIPPDQYHRFIELPHDKRKRILQSIIDGAKSFSPGDIADIIEEEGNDTEEDIANDGWGDSLQLRDELRQDFFEVVYTRFAAADRELLKKLLREASRKSIAAFLAAYTSPAFASDHIELLETMLLLYKNEPELTVNIICNHPEKINDNKSFFILSIIRAVGPSRLGILTKLQSFLS